MDKPAPARIQLQYLSRIQKAVKVHDAEMLAALYAQCEQLNIAVPHYEIPDDPTDVNAASAVEFNSDGTLSIHMNMPLTLNGVTKPLEYWCEKANISRVGLRYRLCHGKSLEEALVKKSNK